MGDRKPQVDPEQAICGHSFLAKQDHHRGGRSECEATGRDYRAPAWGDQSNPVCLRSGPGSPQVSASQTGGKETMAVRESGEGGAQQSATLGTCATPAWGLRAQNGTSDCRGM